MLTALAIAAVLAVGTPDTPNSRDELRKHEWYLLNEDCRGDPAAPPDICRLRDQIEQLLRARGWCYDYPDRPRYQARWHRCVR